MSIYDEVSFEFLIKQNSYTSRWSSGKTLICKISFVSSILTRLLWLSCLITDRERKCPTGAHRSMTGGGDIPSNCFLHLYKHSMYIEKRIIEDFLQFGFFCQALRWCVSGAVTPVPMGN